MNSALCDDIRSRCEQRFRTWFPGSGNSTTSLSLVRQQRFRWSKHYVFRAPGKPKTDAIRILAKHATTTGVSGYSQSDIRPETDALLMEFQALSLLYEHLDGASIGGVTAVRPLDYFPDIDVLVVEYASGKNLLSLLWDAAKPWATRTDLDGALRAAHNGGRLLGAIHQIPRSPYPKMMPADAKQYLLAFREAVEYLLDLVPDQGVHSHLRVVQVAAEKHASSLRDDVCMTHLHGDYYPRNLVRVEDGCVLTVDTTLHRMGPAEDDIAKFLVGISTTKQRILAGPSLVKPDVVRAVRMRFTQGYRTQAQFSRPFLLLAELLACIRRWAEIVRALYAKVARPLAAVIRRARINPVMLAYLESIRRRLPTGNSGGMSH